MKNKIICLIICVMLLLTGCGTASNPNGDSLTSPNTPPPPSSPSNPSEPPAPSEPGNSIPDIPIEVPDLGGDDTTYGDDIDDSGAYDGFFEEELKDLSVECISGTKNVCKLNGSTLTFTEVREDTVYSIKGSFSGNIIIDAGNNYKFDLELNGFSLVSSSATPIVIESGDEVTIKAKKETQNFIYDTRLAVDSNSEAVYSGAIYSKVDLEIAGKGELTVVSENNNGIHSKKDLQVKNLTLFVVCLDNALKGNDSVEIESGNTTLIASVGDCIKTTNSDISEKNNQRGSITISGGTHVLYAACDGIDAAYNSVIDGAETSISIYTDKYSNYSQEVNSPSEKTNYIRNTSKSYSYSVKYYNSDSDFVWVNAEYHSTVSGGRTTYYYYSYPTMSGYSKVQFFVYESSSQQSQDSTYKYKSDYLTPNTSSDTFAIRSSYSSFSYEWTNYTTSTQNGGWGGPMGPGGMGDGNSDKGDHSTKGIKASNEIIINNGTINIKSYDDAIHANNDTTLENGESPLGNVTINGGNLTLYSNDDGIHADGISNVNGGIVSILNAYEGVEGKHVNIAGGYVSINSKDDGINATTTSGTAITISGGYIYIYCTGDGIDSNSKTSNVGIVITGGQTVVIANSNMNSALDTENYYTYTAGYVVAISNQGGMSSESTHCSNFSSVGTSKNISLTSDKYLVVNISGTTATIKMPVSLSANVVVLGDKSATVTTATSTNATLDTNGVAWN